MNISRRDFLKYCTLSAAALGLSGGDLLRLQEVLANPAAPTIVWIQGASCTGCSISLLNRIAATAPQTVATLLTDSINLAFHPTLMAVAGEDAVAELDKAYTAGNYILVVEGGVPTAFNGNTCWPWSVDGVLIPFQDAVIDLAAKAMQVVCVGTCASFGGMSAAPPNPTGVKSVKSVIGKNTLNISGCPPHPDWMVWAIVQLLLGNTIATDSNGRPTQIYGRTIHSQCPRQDDKRRGLGMNAKEEEGECLYDLGCRGPQTEGTCPSARWNNGNNWCVNANSPCLGCTDPTFPGSNAFSNDGGGGEGPSCSVAPGQKAPSGGLLAGALVTVSAILMRQRGEAADAQKKGDV